MFGLGLWELLLIGILIFVFFGYSRLPDVGRSLGDMVSKFKKAKEEEPPKLPPTDEPPKT